MCRKCPTWSLSSFRCGTHDHTWSCWGQRRFKLISWLPSASWLSFGRVAVSRRPLCFHIWAGIRQGNDMLRDPAPAASTLSICHASGQRCAQSTGMSRHMLAWPTIRQCVQQPEPKGTTLPWELAKITGQRQRDKSRRNPSNLTSSFIPSAVSSFHTENTLSLHLFPLAGLILPTEYVLFLLLSLQFCLPPRPLCGRGKLRLVYEVSTNIARTPGTMWGLECDPAVWNVSVYAVFTGAYLCL